MIIRLHSRFRLLRRVLKRSRWIGVLLGMHPYENGKKNQAKKGLILIQIDGFSRIQLQKALKNGKMPFMAWLLRRENYVLRSMYSGLPSNTPAVQGELFYGVRGIVPAFSFFDRTTQRIRKMLQQDTVKNIEDRLAQKGEALMCGGSCYSNIYTGGAKEPRFCAASWGWGTSTRSPGPITLSVVLTVYLFSAIRSIAYGFLELALAINDAIKGIRKGQSMKQELIFAFARVGICILMREWITNAAKIDVTRGLPIVHLNLIGYDEQSHRRGPNSRFAHWVLKGIDDSIKRIWKESKLSGRREYDIWIYSDHGQIESTPYHQVAGHNLKETVMQLWNNGSPENISNTVNTVSPAKQSKYIKPEGIQLQRIVYFGGKRLQYLFAKLGLVEAESSGVTDTSEETFPVVTTMGPTGMVYLKEGELDEKREALGKSLAASKGIELVFDTHCEQGLQGWSKNGEFQLPRDKETLLTEHPFQNQVIEDMQRLCRNEFVGDLVVMGWRAGIKKPVTFADENGSHGSISPEECEAFLVLPEDDNRVYLSSQLIRPIDIYQAGMIYQGKMPIPGPPQRNPALVKPSALRILSYNVHSCVGLELGHSPERIAKVIGHYQPDIVALQELDHKHHRSNYVHQANKLAELLDLEVEYHPVRIARDQEFGNAILSRFPIRILKSGALPHFKNLPRSESRGALWVEFWLQNQAVQLVNTHFGLWPQEQRRQVSALMGPEWLENRDTTIPLIVCGDFNSGPKSHVYKQITRSLGDAQALVANGRPKNTWFSQFPYTRLDHAFISQHFKVEKVQVPDFHLARVASDHLPLVIDLSLKNGLH